MVSLMLLFVFSALLFCLPVAFLRLPGPELDIFFVTKEGERIVEEGNLFG
jgi:hypothetical protein